MTNQQAIGAGLLVAGFWYYVLRGASALRIGLKRLRLLTIGLDASTIEALLYVYNPLLATVFVREVQGTIYIQGQPVGVVNYPVNRRIQARSTTYIPVQLIVSPTALGAAAWQNIMSGSIQTLTIELKGTIRTGEQVVLPIPIRKTWTYNDIIEREAQ